MLDISFAADKIIKISQGFYITNTVLATWVTMAVVISVAAVARLQLAKGSNNYLVISSKLIVKFFYNFIDGILEERELSLSVLPLIATLFIYITTANWLGLVPGFVGSFVIRTGKGAIPIFKSINSDLNTTFSMALVSIFLVKVLSAKFPEAKDYLRIGVNKVFRAVLIFFEDLSEVTRVISLSFRLGGNVFAGEVLMLITGVLLPYFLPIPFMFLEFFIGAFQALVFSVLILVFVKW